MIAARWNRSVDPGTEFIDYQSADLGIANQTWTIRGKPMRRSSAPQSMKGSHIRLRHYLADADLSVVVRLLSETEEPTSPQIAHALQYPARVLYLGRKNCIPSCYLLDQTETGASAAAVLMNLPLPEGPQVQTLNTFGKIDFRTCLESGWVWWNEVELPVENWPMKEIEDGEV